MKKLRLIGLVSTGLFLVACSNSNAPETMDEVEVVQEELAAKDLDGKTLMETKCTICHGNGSSHDDILAPPMRGVKNHYLEDGMTEDEFVSDIVNWVNNPTEENSKMPGAVKRFKVMPKQEFDQAEVEAIAKYIYNNDMPKPNWFDKHMQEEHGEE